MDIPHIYQPISLFLGLMLILVGFPMLLNQLLRLRKQSFQIWADSGGFFGRGIWFMTSGPYYLSRAFDPPHQESSLTSNLFWLAVAGFVTILTLYLLARHLQKSQPEQMTAKVEK